jgi:hypothetical protein
MRLNTHSLLLMALANCDVDSKGMSAVALIIASKGVLQNEVLEKARKEDPTGYKAARILVEAAAYLALAADRILNDERK